MERVSVQFDQDAEGCHAAAEIVAKLKRRRRAKLEIDEHPGSFIYIGPVVELPGEVVVAGIGAISAVISSALTYLATKKSGKIVLKGKTGRTIEIPAGTNRGDLAFYVKKCKELDIETARISSSSR